METGIGCLSTIMHMVINGPHGVAIDTGEKIYAKDNARYSLELNIVVNVIIA